MTAGAATYTGQTIGLTGTVTPTPGAVTGPARTSVSPTLIASGAGAVTWTSSTTITFLTGVVVSVTTPGAITWQGQTTIGLRADVTAGSVTFTGQALGLKTSIASSAGAVSWTGQTIGLKTTITPTAGVVTWQGPRSVSRPRFHFGRRHHLDELTTVTLVVTVASRSRSMSPARSLSQGKHLV